MKIFFKLFLLFLIPLTSFADSWTMPQIQKIDSVDKSHWVQIKPAKKDAKPTAVVENHKTKQVLWKIELPYESSPVKALLSNDGKTLVTFDEWGRVGHGKYVMVIFREGKVVKNYSLKDLPIKNIKKQIPSTVSSRWWRGKISIDDQAVSVDIVQNAKMPGDTAVQFKTFRFDLKTGKRIQK